MHARWQAESLAVLPNNKIVIKYIRTILKFMSYVCRVRATGLRGQKITYKIVRTEIVSSSVVLTKSLLAKFFDSSIQFYRRILFYHIYDTIFLNATTFELPEFTLGFQHYDRKLYHHPRWVSVPKLSAL